MSKKQIGILSSVAAAAAAVAAVLAATGHSGTDRANPPPAASGMAALHEAPTAASTVPPAAASALAMMPGVEIDKARRLISGIGSKGYAVDAAPAADGSVCIGTPVGGGCFQSFADDGVSFDVGMNNDGPASPSDRELIAGVASDDVTKIFVVAGGHQLPVPLRNGGFIYESPQVGLWADALLVKLSGGTAVRTRVGNANRVEAIP